MEFMFELKTFLSSFVMLYFKLSLISLVGIMVCLTVENFKAWRESERVRILVEENRMNRES